MEILKKWRNKAEAALGSYKKVEHRGRYFFEGSLIVQLLMATVQILGTAVKLSLSPVQFPNKMPKLQATCDIQ